MEVNEEKLQIQGSLNSTKRKLAIGKHRMYALRDKQGSITHNLDEIIQVAERFYTRLWASDVIPGENAESSKFTCDVRVVTEEEIGKAIRVMKRGKAAGDDGITRGERIYYFGKNWLCYFHKP